MSKSFKTTKACVARSIARQLTDVMAGDDCVSAHLLEKQMRALQVNGDRRRLRRQELSEERERARRIERRRAIQLSPEEDAT